MNNKSDQNKNHKQKLSALRHTTEHIFNQAIEELFPGKITKAIGPAIDDGWYNDSRWEYDLSEDDFSKIEKRMKKIIKANFLLVKKEISEKQARKIFKNNPFKQKLIDELTKNNENLSVFFTGDPEKEPGFYKKNIAKKNAQELPGNAVFVDLCKGPHVKSTNEIKAYKLLSIAGAYWKGNEKNEMLTRVYGTTFENQKQLDNYLEMLKQAEEKNHRKIGKEMELFAIFPKIGQGLPVWLPNGFAMRSVLEQYMYGLERSYGYEHILTPHINKKELFEQSGHLGFYDESMYAPVEVDKETFYLKPMNCPAGMQVYNMKPRSYRDLPMKVGEMGTVYRYEKSGELHGLQRVRGFTQNDAHIFCTPEQLEDQFMEVLEMLEKFYLDMGFENYKYRLSLSSEGESEKYVGKRDDWLKAEDAMRKMLEKNDVDFYEVEGEAAFYGPKIDVQAINVFGKEDSIATVQVDFNLPERFDLNFVNDKGEEQRPFVIHRALIGSFERFFAFLIEYYGGKFPLWFAPKQFVILPVSDKFTNYANLVNNKIKQAGNKYNLWIRSDVDNRNETLQSRIRDAELQKYPYILIVGSRDKDKKEVSLRIRSKGNIGSLKLDKFINQFIDEINEKKLKSTMK